MSDRDAQSGNAAAIAVVRNGGVVVKPYEKTAIKDERGNALLYMPDEHVKKPTRGMVVAASKGRRATETGSWIETEAKSGDDVAFAMHARTHDVYLDGERFLWVRDEDILFVIAKDAKVDIRIGTTDVAGAAKK